MTIEKAILSAKEPKETNTAWVQPKGDSLQLNIFNNGKWRPIAGSGSSSSSSSDSSSESTAWPVDPNAPMLSNENILAQLTIIEERLGIDNSTATSEQWEQIFNELKSVKFATYKQGNAVLVNYDLESNILTFQCDDGSIITITGNQGGEVITGLRPDIDGYIIWQTTIDKLPVRESQEETDPVEPDPVEPNPGGGNTPKSVKSGLLGLTPPSTGVYTVIDNNTGEIVDPLELHKLTNVIWHNNLNTYYPFYLQGVLDFYSLADSITSNDDYISTWVSTANFPTKLKYISVSLYYDYTLKPNSMSKIQTTNNSSVSDIDNFFNFY